MAKQRKGLMREIMKNITSLLAAAFGLVAALAWNGAIMSLFTSVFGTPNALGPRVVYAVLATVLAVIVTLYISRLAAKLSG